MKKEEFNKIISILDANGFIVVDEKLLGNVDLLQCKVSRWYLKEILSPLINE